MADFLGAAQGSSISLAFCLNAASIVAAFLIRS
jgi:hypothetical protein